MRKSSLRHIKEADPDDAASYASTINKFSHLCNILPPYPVMQPQPLAVVHTIAGPADEQSCTLQGCVFAQTVSTYPISHSTNVKLGTPICDRYSLQVCADGRTIICISDGCNWGKKPLEASRRASSKFVSSLIAAQSKITRISDAGALLLQALVEAHNEIVYDKTDVWEAGTTTLLGGFILPFKKGSGKKHGIVRSMSASCGFHQSKTMDTPSSDEPDGYACVLIGVGDCKAFHWSAAMHRITDITRGNRRNLNDPSDPGGRIGPFLEGGLPDLRNLCIYYQECSADDAILFVSDGVHDNLEPRSLGLPPGDLCCEFKGLGWDAAVEKNKALADDLREGFMASRLESILFGTVPAGTQVDSAKHVLNPIVVGKAVIDYCVQTTTKSRNYMDTSDQRLPEDYARFPGCCLNVC
eukprot:TRINITY_DN4412_c0_g1_i3.p1 TRINITY_DN4412_c0_g1~~TRINITY_DN4412_c0_g1_i3.p1  ORF type:complete len:473 (-),score=85.16 TRINITY_DN4412_c0_g1_i3:326-1561(-)